MSAQDKNGVALQTGDPIRFETRSGRTVAATVAGNQVGQMVPITLKGDPFPTNVVYNQVTAMTKTSKKESSMPTTTAVSPKELRRQAKALGVKGWEEMDKDELAAAIAEAEGEDTDEDEDLDDTEDDESEDEDEDEDDEEDEDEPPARPAKKATASKKAAPAKTSTKSRPAAKSAPAKTSKKVTSPAKAAKSTKKSSKAKAAPVVSEGNPFRPGSNLHIITEALMKGGKRSTLVSRIKDKLAYNPRVKDSSEFDTEAETDRRLKVIGYILKNQHGWNYEHEGRGPDAFIKCTPPE